MYEYSIATGKQSIREGLNVTKTCVVPWAALRGLVMKQIPYENVIVKATGFKMAT